MQINLCLKLDKSTKTYHVHITEMHLIHNHEVSEERYKDYPQACVLTDPAALEAVAYLHKYGSDRKGILKFITENTTFNPTSKDVSNLLAKMKASRYADFSSVEARVYAFLKDFCEQKGYVGRVFTNANRVVKAITLQTAHMRRMFARFSEVLLIDATNNTNKERYKLFSFMIHDALGQGQHVQVLWSGQSFIL